LNPSPYLAEEKGEVKRSNGFDFFSQPSAFTSSSASSQQASPPIAPTQQPWQPSPSINFDFLNTKSDKQPDDVKEEIQSLKKMIFDLSSLVQNLTLNNSNSNNSSTSAEAAATTSKEDMAAPVPQQPEATVSSPTTDQPIATEGKTPTPADSESNSFKPSTPSIKVMQM